MSALLLARDTCSRFGCPNSVRFGPQPMVVVLLGEQIDINAGRASNVRMAESVKVYCSHRCEALDRPEEVRDGGSEG
jgi:hypothetical protein